MKKSGLSMISRVLSVYHLFMFCEQVSVKEITDQMPEVKPETVRRDIKLLKDAGVLQVEYSRKAKACIPLELKLAEPVFPESKRKTMEKIRRLCILMRELEEFENEEKPLHIEQYKKLFPDVTDRTRQRDFAELAKVGYVVRHEIDLFAEEENKWVYSFSKPYNTYDLPTFHEKDW